jgi:hypothetical protein
MDFEPKKINPKSAVCGEIYENGLKAGSNGRMPLTTLKLTKSNTLFLQGNCGGSDGTRTRDLRRDRPDILNPLFVPFPTITAS